MVMNLDLIISEKNELEAHVYFKYLLIFSFLLIFVDSVLLLITPPVSHYELSIYGAYPLIFWVCMAIGIVIGMSLILSSAINNNAYWKYGLFAIIFWYCILFFLPVIRGYAFSVTMTGDVFDHFAYTLPILSSGFLSKTDIYPISHILLAIVNLFGIDFNVGVYIFNALFSFIYILFLYILGKAIFKNNNALYFLFFSVPLLFSNYQTSFIPFIFALFMLPLVLYCIHNLIQSNKPFEFRLITCILIFTLVFFHPLVEIYLLIILIIIKLFILRGDRIIIPAKGIGKHIDILIVFSVISFILWIIHSYSMILSFQDIFTSIFYPVHTTIAQHSGNLFETRDVSFLQIIEIFMKWYGQIIPYAFLGTICFVYLIKKFFKSKKMDSFAFMYASITLLGVLLGIVMTFTYSLIFEPIRVMSLAIVMDTILCSLVFCELFLKITSMKYIKLLAICLIAIISIASILGLLNIYPSPWDWSPGSHITKMEFYGTDWTLAFSDRSIPINNIVENIDKYVTFYLAKPGSKHDPTNFKFIEGTIPSHFGYETNRTNFKTLSGQHQYLILKESVKQMQFVVPSGILSKTPRFSSSDYVRLNTDPTVNKIYTNPDFDVFKL